MKMGNVKECSQFLAIRETCVWVVIAELLGFQMVHYTTWPDVQFRGHVTLNETVRTFFSFTE